jgi:hypothetical protein
MGHVSRVRRMATGASSGLIHVMQVSRGRGVRDRERTRSSSFPIGAGSAERHLEEAE